MVVVVVRSFLDSCPRGSKCPFLHVRLDDDQNSPSKRQKSLGEEEDKQLEARLREENARLTEDNKKLRTDNSYALSPSVCLFVFVTHNNP